MPLVDILDAMESDAAAQIRQIDDDAARSAARIRADGDADSRAIRERHLREIQLSLQQERARCLNRARLAALRHLSAAREQLFAQALGCASARLERLRADPCYPAILRRLAEEACAQVDGELVLRVDPRDQAGLRALFPSARIDGHLHVWGGIEATTPDGRIVVINTLEARLEQSQEALRQVVMPLFADQPDV